MTTDPSWHGFLIWLGFVALAWLGFMYYVFGNWDRPRRERFPWKQIIRRISR